MEEFKNAMKEKRTGKRKARSHDILQKEEIVIQRLSPEVSGKAQKYLSSTWKSQYTTSIRSPVVG